MLFWTSAAQVAAKLETMRAAEAKLVAFARRFSEEPRSSTTSTHNFEIIDTEMPSSILPLSSKGNPEEEHVVMHGIRVTNNNKNNSNDNKETTSPPLVMVHGYMNGALYFYRNLLGLSNHFHTVYSLDLMGWGLSSRPGFHLEDDSVETAESFFVESLEAWRSKNNVDKMILAGHSMGGYLSVAYCEKYPERVDHLILLSPVGVPHQTDEQREEARSKFLTTFSRKAMYGVFMKLWDVGSTPGTVMRTLPESKGKQMVSSYIDKRLPAISDPDEKAALADYLYTNSILPGSGEYGLNRLLNAGAYAKKPTLYRIPKLQVGRVSFLYGEHDWMDNQGGLDVQVACEEQRQKGEGHAPEVEVFKIPNAGHLLMLDNWNGFNSAVIMATGGENASYSKRDDAAQLPLKLYHDQLKARVMDDKAESNEVMRPIQVSA